jgi:hypothetical protein
VVGTREMTGRVSEAVSGFSPAQEVSEVTRQVLMEAGSSPKAALMSLSAQVDADLRNAMQARGVPVERNKSGSDSVTLLRGQGFPKDLMDSLVHFRMIRNNIVHGYEGRLRRRVSRYRLGASHPLRDQCRGAGADEPAVYQSASP